MFLKSLVSLALLAVANAGVITYKVTDFQGSSVDLTGGSPSSLTPVQSSTTTKEASQNWLFIYAMRGDPNEYRVMNAAGSGSILSYATENNTTPGPGIHSQIVGNQNVGTFWYITPATKGFYNFIEKRTGLAMTAWPAGNGSDRNSPLTLEVHDTKNARQVFQLTYPTA